LVCKLKALFLAFCLIHHPKQPHRNYAGQGHVKAVSYDEICGFARFALAADFQSYAVDDKVANPFIICCKLESLLRRVINGESLWNVSSVVDCYRSL